MECDTEQRSGLLASGMVFMHDNVWLHTVHGTRNISVISLQVRLDSQQFLFGFASEQIVGGGEKWSWDNENCSGVVQVRSGKSLNWVY